MNRDDVQKLLGGYATGTLTPEERQALYEAALDDQELFDAIAREQALQDLLRDAEVRSRLLTALEERPARWYTGLIRPVWRPAAGLALAGAAILVVVLMRQPAQIDRTELMARVSPPPASPQPVFGDRAATANAPLAEELRTTPTQPRKVAPQVKAVRSSAPAEPASASKPLAADSNLAANSSAANAPPPPPPVSVPSPQNATNVANALNYVQVQPAPQQQAPPTGAGSAGAEQKQQQLAQGSFNGLRPGSVGGVTGGLAGQQQGHSQQASEQLAASGATQTVEVTASAALLQSAQNARELYYGTVTADTEAQKTANKKAELEKDKGAATPVVPPAAPRGFGGGAALAGRRQAAAIAGHPGVRYAILRKGIDGKFEAVAPDALKAGDTVRLEFQANELGLLLVTYKGANGQNHTLLNSTVAALLPVSTPALGADVKEISVTFARRSIALDRVAMRDFRSGTPQQEATGEPASYVVGQPGDANVQFEIKLNFR